MYSRSFKVLCRIVYIMLFVLVGVDSFIKLSSTAGLSNLLFIAVIALMLEFAGKAMELLEKIRNSNKKMREMMEAHFGAHTVNEAKIEQSAQNPDQKDYGIKVALPERDTHAIDD